MIYKKAFNKYLLINLILACPTGYSGTFCEIVLITTPTTTTTTTTTTSTPQIITCPSSVTVCKNGAICLIINSVNLVCSKLELFNRNL